jgi:hypothetical protein
MPVHILSEDYTERCVSAANLYVESYNKNMKNEILQGICLPLDKAFKQDRFKSMTGQEWVDEYDGMIRWDQINMIAKRIEEIGVIHE